MNVCMCVITWQTVVTFAFINDIKRVPWYPDTYRHTCNDTYSQHLFHTPLWLNMKYTMVIFVSKVWNFCDILWMCGHAEWLQMVLYGDKQNESPVFHMFNIKTPYYQYRHSHYQIRPSHDRLVFIMEVHTCKDGLYIETGLRAFESTVHPGNIPWFAFCRWYATVSSQI